MMVELGGNKLTVEYEFTDKYIDSILKRRNKNDWVEVLPDSDNLPCSTISPFKWTDEYTAKNGDIIQVVEFEKDILKDAREYVIAEWEEELWLLLLTMYSVGTWTSGAPESFFVDIVNVE